MLSVDTAKAVWMSKEDESARFVDNIRGTDSERVISTLYIQKYIEHSIFLYLSFGSL